VVDPTTAYGADRPPASVLVSPSGEVSVGYADDDGTVVWARRVAEGWEPEAVARTSASGLASFALDAAGVQVAYCDWDGLHHARRTPDGWVTEFAAAADYCFDPDLALDGDGAAHAVFMDDGEHGRLIYVTNAAGTWTKETADAYTYAHRGSVAIDGSGVPHVVHHGSSGVEHAVRTPEGWVADTIDPLTGDGNQTAIVIDRTGAIRVVYRAGNLRYAVHVADGWEVSNVSFQGGWSCALAVDDRGGVHIVFDNDAPGDLVRYATRSGGVFVWEGVDCRNGESESAFTIDVAIDPATGTLHAAYYGHEDSARLGTDFRWASRPLGSAPAP
jgi:hypothetical protein